ncbi:MAG: ABC transporter permease [Spirochaetes bacterium]|nr:ABC transporter permease [Spirochaetota bacterium]MBU0956505.1 ABC transporter permease [Spirochaetota bacterium]
MKKSLRSARPPRSRQPVFTLLERDSILLWRNGHVLVTAILMVVMMTLTLLLPERIAGKPKELVLDQLTGSPLQSAYAAQAKLRFASDEAGLRASLADDPGLTGIILRGTLEQPQATILAGAHLPDSALALLEASIDELLRRTRNSAAADTTAVSATSAQGTMPAVHYLEAQRPEPPLYLRGLPVFLIFEAGILGFLLVAVFVFQEKQEGTLRAFLVTPAKRSAYLLSKLATFTLLSLLYGAGVLAAGLLRGVQPNLAGILLTLTAAAASLTLLGLGFATFFDNLSQWFFPGLGVLVLNMAPFLGSVNPVFQPFWLSLAPSWPFLKLAEHFLQPGGQLPILPLILAASWLAGSAIFCTLALRFKLLKGAA